MAHRRKLGDVYAIPLPNGTFAFCRVLQSAGAAFYKHRGKNTEDIPLTEEYEFTVYVYNHAFREWVFVVNRPFENEEEAWPPPTCWVDQLTGKGSLYIKGKSIPCSYGECKMFFEFEQFLNAHPEYKLVYSDGESEVDLLELSDGLFGEMFGDDGWIEKHSEFDGKDYF